jgi:polysaccharide biosynthesis transport protein
MQKAEEKQTIQIQEYVRVFWKRRWLVLSVFVVILVSTILGIAATNPKFSATAQLLIEREESANSLRGTPYVSLYDINQLMDTYAHILKTNDFLQKVADELNLKVSQAQAQGAPGGQDPYAKEPLHWLFSNLRTATQFYKEKSGELFGGASKDKEEEVGQADQDGARKEEPLYKGEKLLRMLTIKPIPRTQIIQIECTHPDPAQASLIANTVALSFIKERLNRRLAATNQAVQWLQNQLKLEQTELDKSRIELYNFMQQFGILSLDESRSTKLDEELLLTKEKVRDAAQKTTDLRLKYEQIVKLSTTPGQVDTIPEAATNEVLKKIREEEMKLEQESIKLASTYGSNHPKIQLINKQLSNIRESKHRELQRIVNSVKYQYESAQSYEKSLTQAQDNLQKQLEEMKKKTIRYYTLKREVDSSEKVYDVLLNRFKETGLSEEIGRSTNISIVQSAEVPLVPSTPNIPRILAVAVFLGMCLAVGLAFLLEFLDNTLTKPDQLEHQLGLTFLGAIPLLTADAMAKTNGNGRALVSLDSAQSSGAEAYRALRTSILLSSADLEPQVLLVTSSGKSEGKTSTAANLAVVMAQAGNRVLLVDCDLRKPRMHKVFGLDRDYGLSNMLVAKKLEPEAFLNRNVEPNLDVITCGPIPPNPSELLGSKRMRAMLELMRQEYDRIILDTPPVLAATDAAVLTSMVDGTVLVVRASQTTRQMAQRAVKLLLDLRAKITGVVLNEISLGRNGYYYDYYYHYGSYYGEEGEHKEKNGWMKKMRKSRKNVDTQEA